MRKLYKSIVLFFTGGGLYLLIETFYCTMMGDPLVHWAMLFVGGAAFVLIGGINEWIPYELSLVKQSLIGAIVVMLTELICGCILNVWCGFGIWDYSGKFLNLCGQTCLQFMPGWLIFSGVAIVLDDYLQHWMFGEKKPQYRIINVKKSKRKRKKIEFSKILVAWAMALTTLCVIFSYVLSFSDHDPASDVTVAVVSTCIAIAVAYEAKSYGEKNSRNKYGVDQNGYGIASGTDDENAVG